MLLRHNVASLDRGADELTSALGISLARHGAAGGAVDAGHAKVIGHFSRRVHVNVHDVGGEHVVVVVVGGRIVGFLREVKLAERLGGDWELAFSLRRSGILLRSGSEGVLL